MSQDEVWGRYAYAKASAATMLQALLHCECEVEEVIEALEVASIWRLMVSTNLGYTTDLLGRVMEATDGWDEGQDKNSRIVR